MTSSATPLVAAAQVADASPWSLDALRSADPALGLAVVVLLAVVLADLLHRHVRLPRAIGWLLIGALAGPLALGLIQREEVDPLKPLIDLAIGMLVFELGSRIRPRWLYDNPWLAVACVLEGLLAGIAVAGTLIALDAPWLSAVVAGAVAMSTSPVLTLTVAHELRPRGQVTERLMMMCAVNSALAMLSLNAVGVLVRADGSDLGSVGLSVVYVVFGSFLLGTAMAGTMNGLSKLLHGAGPVLQITLVILATLLAARWTLSPLLALLAAGVMARRWLAHRLSVEPNFGSAGAALNVLLLVSMGVLFAFENSAPLWPWVLAIVVARFAGKGVAVAATARLSGMGWRQALALTIALQPMTSLVVLLAADNFGWPTQLPGMDASVLRALLAATTLMQLTGPLWTLAGLKGIARETDTGDQPNVAG